MSLGVNSNIELLTFPIEDVNGRRENLFRGFVENKVTLQLQDWTAVSLVDNSGYISLLGVSVPAYISNGDKFTIASGTYAGKTGTVSGKTSGSINLDIDFIGNDSSVLGYKNRLENNYKLEYRFVSSDTVDIQTGAKILGDASFFVSNDISGIYEIDISLVSDLFEPTFEVIDSDNEEMNLQFQLQIREIESGAALGTWETVLDTSMAGFNEFILCHSTGDNARYSEMDTFLDRGIETRIWRGYDKPISFIISDANRSLVDVAFRQNEYTQAAVLLSSSNSTRTLNNGVNAFVVSIVNSTARFVDMIETASSDVLRLTVFDTLLDETEYYLTWTSETGSFRTWLFNAVNTNEYDYDKLSIESLTFRDIPTKANRTVTLSTRGLNANEFEYIKSMLASNLIKVENDGIVYECSINNDSISYENKKDTYDFEFELNIKPNKTMRV